MKNPGVRVIEIIDLPYTPFEKGERDVTTLCSRWKLRSDDMLTFHFNGVICGGGRFPFFVGYTDVNSTRGKKKKFRLRTELLTHPSPLLETTHTE